MSCEAGGDTRDAAEAPWGAPVEVRGALKEGWDMGMTGDFKRHPAQAWEGDSISGTSSSSTAGARPAGAVPEPALVAAAAAAYHHSVYPSGGGDFPSSPHGWRGHVIHTAQALLLSPSALLLHHHHHPLK